MTLFQVHGLGTIVDSASCILERALIIAAADTKSSARDALTAAAEIPEGDGYQAALTNFRYLANAAWTMAEAKAFITRATPGKP